MAVVLVVDDESDLRDLIALRIRALGHEVRMAGGVAEALDLVAATGAPDLAVLDVNMGDGDGRDLLARLRITTPDLPAFFVTGVLEGADSAKDLDAGYLAKPFSGAQLKALVTSFLSGPGRVGAATGS